MALASPPASSVPSPERVGSAVHCVEASSEDPEPVGRMETPSPRPPAHTFHRAEGDRGWSLDDADAWWIAGSQGRRRQMPSEQLEGEVAAPQADHWRGIRVEPGRHGRAASVEPSQPSDPRAEDWGCQRAARDTMALIPVRPERPPYPARSGRFSPRHRDAIVRAGGGAPALTEPVQSCEALAVQRRSVEIDANGPREPLPPAAERLAEEVLNTEIEGLGECLSLCAQRSRTLKLLGFQHLHYDARLQTVLRAKARRLGLNLVSELLLLARGLFAFREATRHRYIWERLRAAQQVSCSATSGNMELSELLRKARRGTRGQLGRALAWEAQGLLRSAFSAVARHRLQEKLIHSLTKNGTLRDRAVAASSRHYLQAEREANSRLFNSWQMATVMLRRTRGWTRQSACVVAHSVQTSGFALLSRLFMAWAHFTECFHANVVTENAAAFRTKIFMLTLERQFAALEQAVLNTSFLAWQGVTELTREAWRRRQALTGCWTRLNASADDLLLARCFFTFVIKKRNQQIEEANIRLHTADEKIETVNHAAKEALLASRQRFLAAYDCHFVISEEVILFTALIGWSGAVEDKKWIWLQQNRVLSLVQRTIANSTQMLLQLALCTWIAKVEVAKHQWLLTSEHERLQEQLRSSRIAFKEMATRQSLRNFSSSCQTLACMCFSAWCRPLESIRSSTSKRRNFQALVRHSLLSMDKVLLVKVFYGWDHETELEKHHRQFASVDHGLMEHMAASKSIMMKQTTRICVHMEQAQTFMCLLVWHTRASHSCITKRRNLAHGNLMFSAYKRMIVDSLLCGWHRIAESARSRKQSKRRTTVQLKNRTSDADFLSIVRCFSSWGQVAAVSRVEGLLKDNQKLEEAVSLARVRITQGQEQVLKAVRRQCDCSAECCVSMVVDSWQGVVKATRACRRRKELNAARELRIAAACGLTLKAQCFACLVNEAAAAKGERKLGEANCRIQILSRSLEGARQACLAHEAAAARSEHQLKEELARTREKVTAQATRDFRKSTYAALHVCFCSWAESVAKARQLLRQKERNFSMGTHLGRCSCRLLLSKTMACWTSQTDHAHHELQIAAMSRRVTMANMAAGDGLAINQQRLMTALKWHLDWQFDSSGKHFASTCCFMCWKGLKSHLRLRRIRQEEIGRRASRAASIRDGALSALCLMAWFGVVRESHCQRLAEDRAMRFHGKTLNAVAGLFFDSARAFLRGVLSVWTCLAAAWRRKCAYEEHMAACVGRLTSATSGALVLLCYETWHHEIMAYRLEALLKANRCLEEARTCSGRRVEAHVKLLEQQIAVANRQVLSTHLVHWREIREGMKLRRHGQTQALRRVAAVQKAMLAKYFDGFVRHEHRCLVEKAQHAASEVEASAGASAARRRQTNVRSFQVQLTKMDKTVLKLAVDHWKIARISCKRTKQCVRMAALWLDTSGQELSSKCFATWQRTMLEARQVRLGQQQAAKQMQVIMALNCRQYLLLEQQLVVPFLCMWHSWVSHCVRSRASALRSIAEANRAVLLSTFSRWRFAMQQDNRDQARKQWMALQALGALSMNNTLLLTRCFGVWSHEADGQKRSARRVIRLMRALEQYHAVLNRQILRVAWWCWKYTTEWRAMCRKKKEQIMARIVLLDAVIRNSRVEQSFDAWISGVVEARCSRQLQEERKRLRETHERLEELNTQHTKRKTLWALSRHFIDETRGMAQICLVIWYRCHKAAREAMKKRKESKARLLCSITAAANALMDICMFFWSNEAKHQRHGRLLRESTAKLEAAEAVALRGVTRQKDRSVLMLQRHISMATTELSYWSFHSWVDAVLALRAKRKRKEEFAARALERIDASMTVVKSQCVLLWRCNITRFGLERHLEETARHLETARSACAGAEGNCLKYQCILLWQPVESERLVLGICLTTWIRTVKAELQTRRSRHRNRVLAERALAWSTRCVLVQSLALWACLRDKAKYEERLESYMRDVSAKASCDVELANQRVRDAGACVDEARRAQACTMGSVKEHTFVFAKRAVAVLETYARALCFLSWCTATLSARCSRSSEARCRSFRAAVHQRLHLAAAHSQRWLNAVVLVQYTSGWRLAACIQMQLRHDQRFHNRSFSKGLAYLIKLRSRLHEQRFLYSWLRALPFKPKEPVGMLVRTGTGTEFTREPPSLYTRPVSACDPCRAGAHTVSSLEPESHASPRPNSALELRHHPVWAVDAPQEEPAWQPCPYSSQASNFGTGTGPCFGTAAGHGLARTGRSVLAVQNGPEPAKDLTRLLDAQRACAEGAAAVASATAALLLASTSSTGGQTRPSSSLTSSSLAPSERHKLASNAMVSDFEYKRLLEQNRREVRELRMEQDIENSQPPRLLGSGAWRP